ncbi:hypothetical protein [Alienimonas californiensis]|uniref:hypothetical protein n=1 Tax=Alienimonas californiensis TaxID=2527989 RepID=UPI00119C96CA|nr:hypothetical protein [Alienimonas californiensis]
MLCRLPAIVAAAAYLAAAVGGTGLHALVEAGHAGCGHSHCEHVAFVPEDDAVGEPPPPAANCCGHDHAAHDRLPARHAGNPTEPEGSERDAPAEPHDPHHCAVCQFLAMGQQPAEAPRPVDAAGAIPGAAVDAAPSIARTFFLTKRVRGPPATV